MLGACPGAVPRGFTYSNRPAAVVGERAARLATFTTMLASKVGQSKLASKSGPFLSAQGSPKRRRPVRAFNPTFQASMATGRGAKPIDAAQASLRELCSVLESSESTPQLVTHFRRRSDALWRA